MADKPSKVDALRKLPTGIERQLAPPPRGPRAALKTEKGIRFVGVKMSESLFSRLDAAATAGNVTLSEMVRALIEKGLP